MNDALVAIRKVLHEPPSKKSAGELLDAVLSLEDKKVARDLLDPWLKSVLSSTKILKEVRRSLRSDEGLSPERAFNLADHLGEGSDRWREVASQNVYWAFQYARNVDARAHEITRAGSSQTAEGAYLYARDVDIGPHDVTRLGASQGPRYSVDYARDIDEGPHPDTRKGACEDPYRALEYACHVDLEPRPITRRAACEDPRCAYYYAKDVDRGPMSTTRRAACAEPVWAYNYALDVDGCFHQDTWDVVVGTEYELGYRKELDYWVGVAR